MKKLSIISLLLALVMCVSVAFVACEGDGPTTDPTKDPTTETPKTPATEAQRKDAVLAYTESLFANAPAEGTPELPAAPTLESVTSTIYEAFNSVSFSGKVDITSPEKDVLLPLSTSVPEGYTKSSSDFAIKDGVICVTSDGINFFVYLDENLNLVMIGEDTEGHMEPEAFTLPILAEMPDMSDMTGMIPEDFEMPEIPAITAEDLIVKGERVSLSMDYVKEVFTIVMTTLGEIMGVPEEGIPEFVNAYIVMINSMKIDLYFTVNDDAKVTGYGVDYDIAEAAPLMDAPAFTLTAYASMDPVSGLPTGCKFTYAQPTGELTFESKVTYAGEAIAAVEATLTIINRYEDNASETAVYSVKFNPAGFSAEAADILEVDAQRIADGKTDDMLDVTIKKLAGKLNFYVKMNDTDGEIIVNRFTVEGSLDIISLPTIPALSEDAKELKALAEFQLSKLDDIIAMKQAMEAMADPTEYCYYYYYDEATYTSFLVYGDTDDNGEWFWDVEYEFSLGAVDTITMVKNADGSFTINGQ